MSKSNIYNQIGQKIKEAVVTTYGEDNIKTAFITGSIAANMARPNSDVDIFVCYNDSVTLSEAKKQDFINFYFNLHKELHRTPDDISPGEILSFSELHTAVHRIRHVIPSNILYERNDFDAICWAGMLVSKRLMIIPDTTEIKDLIKLSRSIVWEWAKTLEPQVTLTEGAGEYTDVDKILRQRISCPGYYEAH